MGGSSSSSTRRTYNTTNLSQQGEGNVAGDNNRVTIERADARSLDRLADALAEGVESLSDQGQAQTRDTLDAAEAINADSLDFAGDALGENTVISRQALDAMESVARQAQQAGEEGTQSAMDFVSNYTERAQVGTGGEELRTLKWTAGAVAVALVGMAWASNGGFKA